MTREEALLAFNVAQAAYDDQLEIFRSEARRFDTIRKLHLNGEYSNEGFDQAHQAFEAAKKSVDAYADNLCAAAERAEAAGVEFDQYTGEPIPENAGNADQTGDLFA